MSVEKDDQEQLNQVLEAYIRQRNAPWYMRVYYRIMSEVKKAKLRALIRKNRR